MNIEDELNIKNKKLLEDLRQDFEIDFLEKNINFCEVYTINNKATISYNPKRFKNESIAHELLHIELKRYNYVIGNHIFLSYKNDPKLGKIFTKFLCDYIGNCFDHYKMYPKFIEMGYNPKDFLMNGLDEKCSISDIKSMNLKLLGKYKSKSIDKYIGSLISIYADHIENDYSEHIKLLKEKESELFEIITKFWNKWIVFDIENIDPIFNSDLDLVESFMNDMENWVEYKKIK